MIIDVILDAKYDKIEGNYSPREFYHKILSYYDFWDGNGAYNPADKITAAMDFGTEKDVKAALCEYIIKMDYNYDIVSYILSENWIETEAKEAV